MSGRKQGRCSSHWALDSYNDRPRRVGEIYDLVYHDGDYELGYMTMVHTAEGTLRVQNGVLHQSNAPCTSLTSLQRLYRFWDLEGRMRTQLIAVARRYETGELKPRVLSDDVHTDRMTRRVGLI